MSSMDFLLRRCRWLLSKATFTSAGSQQYMWAYMGRMELLEWCISWDWKFGILSPLHAVFFSIKYGLHFIPIDRFKYIMQKYKSVRFHACFNNVFLCFLVNVICRRRTQFDWLIDWLIDWMERVYAESAIFQTCTCSCGPVWKSPHYPVFFIHGN